MELHVEEKRGTQNQLEGRNSGTDPFWWKTMAGRRSATADDFVGGFTPPVLYGLGAILGGKSLAEPIPPFPKKDMVSTGIHWDEEASQCHKNGC